MKALRVGHGYDVHAFTNGESITLGGVEIPHTQGLLAHSDGDLVLHALCDALLGAAGLGDIGDYFPDTDQRWENVASSVLLKEVLKKISALNYQVNNVDVTLLAQAPKVAGYRAEIKQNIAALLEIDKTLVNFKATTTEGLGYIGREEGIAAHVVALIYQ